MQTSQSNRSMLQHYKAVLLIPDVYVHMHVREMMNVLLNGLGFGAALVQQVKSDLNLELS